MESAKCVMVENYDDFERTIKAYATLNTIYLYFYGRKNDKGASWCNDCNQSIDNIIKARELYTTQDSIFMEVDVGSHEEFMDPLNKFRQDPALSISVIPTLMQWNSVKRLSGSHFCSNPEILQLFFENDD